LSPRPVNRADITLPERTPDSKRKRLYLVIGVVALALLVEGFLVFPSKVTLSDRQGDFKALVTTMKQDVGGCQAALVDGYDALSRIHSGDVKDLKIAKTILQQDEAYCTIAVNSDLYNLATLAPPSSLNRYNLTPVVKNTYAWAFPNAAAILADAQILLTQPYNRSAVTDIESRVKTMNALDREINQELAQVASQLHMAPPRLDLNVLKGMPSFLLGQLSSN
jgi:hypothetical protein